METIVGLGDAGCRVADGFSSYPQYSVFKIDAGLPDASSELRLVRLAHEEGGKLRPWSEYILSAPGRDGVQRINNIIGGVIIDTHFHV